MDTLRVWVNNTPVGRLARHRNGSTFSYDAQVDPSLAVSLTMPVRVASYNASFGILPVFDTNLPEGVLRDRITKALSKAENTYVEDIDILALTGGNQIGRIRILPDGEKPQRREPIGTISDILDREASKELVAEITQRYALRSGVSGAMPKVLLDDIIDAEDDGKRSTIQTRDYILKFDDADYPGLSLNEFHCLEVARLAGSDVTEASLSRDGKMLAVKRFDEKDGERLGFEDFASLNLAVAKEKYIGSIEKNLIKAMELFSTRDEVKDNLERMFRLLVTNIALRNGDAHLKNYAVVFEDAAKGPVRMAPAYDIVTTKVWIKADTMALTYGGTNRWPNLKAIQQMGIRAKLSQARTKEIIDEVGKAIKERMPVMLDDLNSRSMNGLAEKMAACWNEGLTQSLGMDEISVEPLGVSADEECGR